MQRHQLQGTHGQLHGLTQNADHSVLATGVRQGVIATQAYSTQHKAIKDHQHNGTLHSVYQPSNKACACMLQKSWSFSHCNSNHPWCE
jgi:hypothetical protein